ncbi:CAP domain-containing protein [Nitrococcus mobilis]|uniref:SCP domain-containing protein n=1 Tax=Nitrococcus mobilis Nb-231 TaxID=314278 RepID=A4BTX5_9GAMM|nr:CAP domain-containing protein [Nitrococcus mobilis]EAR20796.1 hypothetical protein NB231_10984 [Nitrococcus mobilis Nb-231]
MSQANAYEQFMLELINAERTNAGVQPLAFDGDLNESSENHSSWMIETDTFSHTGANGSSPGDRMEAAGYNFTGSWAWAENIAGMSIRAPEGLQDEVQQLHNMLMNSEGHRANLLNDSYREIGIGFEVGQFDSFEGAVVTQNFARTASDSFLTGVAFDDQDGDKHYDIGEGLSGFTINAQNNLTGAVETTTTNPAGGYALELASGDYTVSFSANGFATTSFQTSIGNQNVKLDLVDPTTSGDTPISTPQPTPEPTPESTPEPQLNTITGTLTSETLHGTSGDDEIFGLGGRDRLFGNAGNDHIEGGNGNDLLWGGAGADILTGGSGRDLFVFDAPFANAEDEITDFSPIDDFILLENSIFSGLQTGRLSNSAFHIGTEAHDSTDQVIYDNQTGALYFDTDAVGGADAQQFAQLMPGLSLQNSDFFII